MNSDTNILKVVPFTKKGKTVASIGSGSQKPGICFGYIKIQIILRHIIAVDIHET